MPYVARKRMTVLGVRYAPGTVVPLDGLPDGVVEKLIGQRRVIIGEGLRPKPAGVPTGGAEVVDRGRGWYDVLVGGTAINDKGLRREDADVLAATVGAA